MKTGTDVPVQPLISTEKHRIYRTLHYPTFKGRQGGLNPREQVAYVAPPKEVTTRQSHHQGALMKFIIDQKPPIPSAASYLVVSFGTTEDRDSAITKLKR
jgi:hypothetical protein